MRRLEVSYEGDARCVPAARHAVAEALAAWGREALGWSLSLLVTELTANVTLHAGTPFTVLLEEQPDGVRLSVTDASPRVPRQRHFGDDATTGRGLLLVEELSRTWGVDRRLDGKTVWAEVAGTGEVARPAGDDDEQPDLDALLQSFPDLEDDAPQARAA